MDAAEQKLILLVEDEGIIALAQKKRLEEYGYRVLIAARGGAALEMSRNRPEIDLILMDINLGNGISGTEAAQLILGERDIPVIFLSSHTERDIVGKTEGITSYGYVVKSSGITVLDAAIKMAFRLFEAKQQLKEREVRLKDQERVLSDILETTLSGYWDWDFSTGTEYLSPAFKKMFGYEPHELPDSPEAWQKIIFKEDLPPVMEQFDRHIKSGGEVPFSVEVRYHHRNGSTVWVICTGRVIEWAGDGSPLRMVGCHVDITGRKLAEEAHLEAELRNRALLEAIPDLMFVFTLDGTFIDYHAADSSLLLMNPDDFIGRSFRDVLPAHLLPHVEKSMAELQQTGTAPPFSYELSSGSSVCFYEGRMRDVGNGSFLLIARDITDIRNTERELADSRKNYANILSKLYDAVYSVDAETFELLLVNDAITQIFGRPKEDFYKNPRLYAEMVHPEDAHIVRSSSEEIFEKRSGEWEYRIIRPDGAVRWVSDRARLVCDGKGVPERIDCIFTDITERKEREEELLKQGVLQQLLMELSFSLINTPLEDVNGRIEEGLKKIAMNVGADRAYLFEYDFDRNRGKNLFEWCDTDVPRIMDQLSNVPLGPLWDSVEIHRRGETIIIPDLEMLPEGPLREFISLGGTRSVIAVPIMEERFCRGFVGFDSVKELRRFSRSEEEILRFFSLIYSNIRLRKKSEEALLLEEQKFRALVEDSHDLIYTLSPEGVFTYVPPNWTKFFGYAQEETLGKSFVPFVHPEDVEACLTFLRRIMETGEDNSGVQYRVLHKEGYYIWHSSSGSARRDSDGSIREYIGISHGIDEQKKAQEALLISEEKYRLLSDLTMEGILIHKDGVALDMNLALAHMLGASKEELLGTNLIDIVLSEDRPLVYEKIGTASTDPYEVRAVRRNGEIFWAELEARDFERDGESLRVVAVRDITERKKAMDEVKALLGEKELILKEVHHRIKNNLTSVIGVLRIQSDSVNEPEASTALQDAVNRIQGMAVLYDRLYRSENHQSMSLRDYLVPLIDEITGVLPKKESILVRTEIADLPLGADVLSPLGITVNELITNAVKYAFPGRDEGLITITAAYEDQQVSLVCEDDGVGLSENFDPDRAAGLGILLIKSMAAQIGGEVRFERVKGTRVVLDFPA